MSGAAVKLCNRGHPQTTLNVDARGKCKVCQKENTAKYRKKHPEKAKEQNAKRRTYKEEWGRQNKDRLNELARSRNRENRAAKRERDRKWEEKNPDKVTALRQAWRARNPDKCKAASLAASISNGVLRKRLGVNDDELFEIKKLTILLQRSLKHGNQVGRADHDHRKNPRSASGRTYQGCKG